MALDIFCVLVVAFFAITGYTAGVVMQVLLIGCLIGAFFLSQPAVVYVNVLVAAWTSLPPAASRICSCFLAWTLVYFALRVIGYYLNRAVGRDAVGQLRPWNKKMGALLGAAKGVVLVFVILCGMDVAVAVARQQGVGGKLATMFAESYSGRAIAQVNPIGRWRAVDRINTLIEVARHPEVLKGIENEQEVRRLITHPEVVAAVKSRDLEAAWKSQDFNAILRNKEFNALISDKELRHLLLNVKLLDTLEERVKKSAAASPKKTG